MKAANYAGVYCCMYPDLAEVARKHGYALAVHGSIARDFDLICIPWVEKPSEPKDVVAEMVGTFALREVGEMDVVEHGRERYNLTLSYGDCHLDLSFMPRKESK